MMSSKVMSELSYFVLVSFSEMYLSTRKVVARWKRVVWAFLSFFARTPVFCYLVLKSKTILFKES